MIRTAILAGLLTAALASPAATQDDETKILRHKLRTLRLDVDFRSADLRSVLDYLREVADINVVLTARNVEGSFTMKAKGVTIQSILNLLLKPQGIGYAIDGGVLVIKPLAELQSEVRLEIIDVRDLLIPIRDFPGAEITLSADSAGAAFSPVADDAPADFPIVELLKAHVGGKTWDDNPRASMQLMNGLLLVRQTPEVIAQVRHVLIGLRRYK